MGQCPRPTCPSSATERFSLAQTLQAAARGLDTDRLRPVTPSDTGLACQPRTLLTLLAYCYASQIYSSADVEAVLRSDANFRSLCRDRFPDARLIRRFRRENRDALEACLEEARDADLALCLWEGDAPPLGAALADAKRPRRAVVLVGPEGGLDHREVDAARARGWRVVGLGGRILRTETAGPAVLAILQSRWGDLGTQT